MKKNNSILTIIIVILSVAIVGLIGYIAYDKLLSDNEVIETGTFKDISKNKIYKSIINE